jgi:multiple antibiotic resistance protein
VTWRAFGQAFVTLLVILDPLGGVPVFLGLTRSLDPAARDHAAYTSVLAASGVLAVFAGFGQVILQYLSISVESLMVAGGVLLFVVALAPISAQLYRPCGQAKSKRSRRPAHQGTVVSAGRSALRRTGE